MVDITSSNPQERYTRLTYARESVPTDIAVPLIGEIRAATSLGFKTPRNMVWLACVVCGKGRWVGVPATRQSDFRNMCAGCFRAVGRPIRYRKCGGRIQLPSGYIQVKVEADDFFVSMRNNVGYVLEHRLVMAKQIGRVLHRWELVHHKNHIRNDNRPENLQLVTDERHRQITILETCIKYLEGILRANNVSFNGGH